MKLFNKTKKSTKLDLKLIEREHMEMDRETASTILELATDPRFKVFLEQLDVAKSESFHKLMDLSLETPNYSLHVASAQGYLRGLEEARRLIRLCLKAIRQQ